MDVALAVTRTVREGLTVGLERPLALAALPVAAVGLWWLVARGDGTAGTRSRRLLLASRLLVVALLVLAAAGPFTVATRETPGDPRVTLLVDESDSTAVTDGVGDLAERVEAAGVPVRRVTVASGDASPLGDAVAANLEPGGTVVLASDGRTTTGRSLSSVAELATATNATVAAVPLEPTRRERQVRLNGPSKTSVGVSNAFLASVDGVELGDQPVTVTVTVDGREVASREFTPPAGIEFRHTFRETGEHRVVATVSGEDRFEVNDVARRTVRVVEPPRLLYVSPREYPLRAYLSELYRVDTASEVPSDLSGADYEAVVLHNRPAEAVGDVEALQRFVIDGGGLVVVGGNRAFEDGGYEGSTLGSMLPVSVGNGTGSSANIVLAVDVSGSAREGMAVQKAIALDALEQLGDDNRVGVVGFDTEAYAVSEPLRLREGRPTLRDRISRLEPGGGTRIAVGLLGAREMLGGSGTVLLISDGYDQGGGVDAALARIGGDVRVITVGTGPAPQEELLTRIADRTGGTYLRATETNRLRIFYGDAERRFAGGQLTVVDSTSFVTSGLTLTANPASSNDVRVRPGADYLVATGRGTPAVASWRYGLGRVLTITTYEDDARLAGMLERPDSLLVTKSVNYAVGDPERGQTGVTEVPDTRVGVPTTVSYRGESRPDVEALRFTAAGGGVYTATTTPSATGFERVLDAEYAVDAAPEYAAFGPSPELSALVDATGGRTFSPSEAAAIAEFARERARQVREVERSWAPAALVAALVVFFAEVLARRLQVYRGVAENESGL